LASAGEGSLDSADKKQVSRRSVKLSISNPTLEGPTEQDLADLAISPREIHAVVDAEKQSGPELKDPMLARTAHLLLLKAVEHKTFPLAFTRELS
jgi:hypothetical protein